MDFNEAITSFLWEQAALILVTVKRYVEMMWRYSELVSMVTDLCEGAFQPILLKTAENDLTSQTCQSFRINDKAVKLIG